MAETTLKRARRRSEPAAGDARAGAVALVLGGLVLVPVPFLQNIPTDPDQNVAFALGANTAAWRTSMLLAMLSVPLLVFGSFALYSHLRHTRARRSARAGLVVTVGFLLFYVPMYSFAAFVVPSVGALIEAGQPNAVNVMDQTFEEPLIAIPFFAGILYNLGYVLTGFAVWRSATLSKWGGLALVIAGVLGVPAFLDVPWAMNVTPIVLALGTLIVGASLWVHEREHLDRSPERAGAALRESG
jgi:hypothetical protein